MPQRRPNDAPTVGTSRRPNDTPRRGVVVGSSSGVTTQRLEALVTRRHGPAVLAAIQGHLRRVDGDADLLALRALAGLAAPGACSEHPPPVTPVAETGERDMTRKTERTERTCGRDEQLVTLTEGEVNERATEMAKLLEEADRVESLMQEETRSTRLRIKALRAGAKEYQRDAVARAASTAAIDVKVKRRRAKRSAETEV